jgi:transcriptional regulator with XRE-family HTH domain
MGQAILFLGDGMLKERLKSLREDKDWTQQNVSEMLFIGRSTYSAYETGANCPPVEVLIRLSRIYNTSVDYILGLTDLSAPYKRR